MEKKKAAKFAREFSLILEAQLKQIKNEEEKFLSKFGLTFPHFFAISILNSQGSLTMKELASFLNLSFGTTTALIDKLVASGLVERRRSRKDRRIVKVSLSEKGTKKVNLIMKWRRERITSFFQNLDEQEVRNFLKVFKSLLNLFNQAKGK